MTERVIDLDSGFEAFDDAWSPKAIAAMNDHLVKLVWLDGSFVWHTHADTDELFLVIDGSMTIELEGRSDVELHGGQLFVVPAGTRHRPVAHVPTKVLLIEPHTVINTGDQTESDLTADVQWLEW